MVSAAPFSRPLLQTERDLAHRLPPGGATDTGVKSITSVWLGGSRHPSRCAARARLAGMTSCQPVPTCIREALANPAGRHCASPGWRRHGPWCCRPGAVDQAITIGKPDHIIAGRPLASATAQNAILQPAGAGDGAGLGGIGGQESGIGGRAQRLPPRPRQTPPPATASMRPKLF